MTLREFLYENQMTMAEFADIIGYHPGYVSQVIRGHMKPGKMFVYQVEKHTKGVIKKDNLSDIDAEKKVKNLVV